MTDSGTRKNPLRTFGKKKALEHWATGGGSPVYIDMYAHMTQGGGSVFSVQDFTSPISKAIQGRDVGSVVRFETNSKLISKKTPKKPPLLIPTIIMD